MTKDLPVISSSPEKNQKDEKGRRYRRGTHLQCGGLTETALVVSEQVHKPLPPPQGAREEKKSPVCFDPGSSWGRGTQLSCKTHSWGEGVNDFYCRA